MLENKLNIDYKKLENFNCKIDRISEKLSSFSEKIEVFSLEKIKTDLKSKIEDFNDEDRKLRIGVIGQVKAGKSSFLNSLLFNGKEILPKASTPKTANLTIIKYSETQSIEIEFYTEEDFEKIKQDSKLNIDLSSVKVAKETMALLEQTGTDPYLYLGKVEKIDISTQKDLEGKLEEYAGEKGKYTAIVKKINLNVN
ncbi:MAG: dynamin family protein, partial [Cetobacterium sp.]